MANPNNPFGLRPVARGNGAPLFVRQYGKPATDTKAIFMNDPVVKAAASVADPTGLGNPMPGITSGQNGTPGTTLWQGVSLNYAAASVASAHYVVDDPFAIFIGQVDGVLSVTVASHVGKNANVKAGTGSATTKQSTFVIDNTTIATTAGEDVRLLGVSNLNGNAEGANAIVEVVFLKHELLSQSTAGV